MHRSRLAFTALASVAVLALGACGDDGGSPSATTPPPSGSPAVDLEAKDNAFVPVNFSITAGGTITLRNTGTALHNFKSTDLGVDTDVAAGKSIPISISGGKKGTFKYTCKYHEALKMEGQITVE